MRIITKVGFFVVASSGGGSNFHNEQQASNNPPPMSERLPKLPPPLRTDLISKPFSMAAAGRRPKAALFAHNCRLAEAESTSGPTLFKLNFVTTPLPL